MSGTGVRAGIADRRVPDFRALLEDQDIAQAAGHLVSEAQVEPPRLKQPSSPTL